MFVSAAKWLGTLATIVGVIFVAFQYFDGKMKSRIERSLDYVIQYQSAEKIAARHNIDLDRHSIDPRPNSQTGNRPDLTTLESLTSQKQGSNDIDLMSHYLIQLIGNSDKEEIMGVLNITEDEAADLEKKIYDNEKISDTEIHRLAEDSLEKGIEIPEVMILAAKPTLEECRDSINKFAGEEIQGLDQIIDDESIKLDDGRKVARYEGKLWWSASNDRTFYAYPWPEITWRFFQANNSKQNPEKCDVWLKEYESAIYRESETKLMSLHELKHFYAALSVCTTTGLCDSFIACEAFGTEVGAFLQEWQDYLELWGPRERRNEYEKLHKFVVRCRSNSEFMRHWDEGKSQLLEAQQFTNYCWEDEEDDGFCWWLRWMAGADGGDGSAAAN